LGKWTGIIVNVYALIWTLLSWLWSFFPEEVHPSPSTMNWSCLAYGAVGIFAIAFWIVDGKRRFQGPVRDAMGDAIEPIRAWELGLIARDEML
jgi:drug/metabolite transporter (DMT)-like permease